MGGKAGCNGGFSASRSCNVAVCHRSLYRTIDMDLITTGVSASERMRRESLVQATRNIIMEKMQIGAPSM
ncbi:hypothetical protein K1719_030727 [Acacia pycnantha]|nr:hypothetical protein K1719_030727 [Acacia pycnantha]